MKKTKVTNDQNDFLSGSDVGEAEIEAAKKILFDAGYKVIKVEINRNIKTSKELKDYFYSRLYSKYPDRYKNRVENVASDMRIISLFIDSRMESGSIGRQLAIQECADIIDIIFDHEDEFYFKYPIRNVNILGQKKLSWVTQKAIEILNRKKYKEMEERSEQMLLEMENSIKVDLKEKEEKLNKMLSRMGEANA